jgi:hypothetical protein
MERRVLDPVSQCRPVEMDALLSAQPGYELRTGQYLGAEGAEVLLDKHAEVDDDTTF